VDTPSGPVAIDLATPHDLFVVGDRPIRMLRAIVMGTCGLILFFDGFDAQAMGYVAPGLAADLDIPRTMLGSAIASGLFGMLFGALAFGSLADRFGRKPVLIASAVVFGLGSLVTASVASIEALIAARIFTGLGMGGALPNAVALTAEYLPLRSRARAVTMVTCGLALGAAVGGWVAAVLISSYGWRGVFVVGGVPPMLIAIGAMVWLPESIEFLRVRQRVSFRHPREQHEVETQIGSVASTKPVAQSSGSRSGESKAGNGFAVLQLFTDSRAGVTLLIWVIYFMSLLDLYFLTNWLPTIMSDAGMKIETAIITSSLFQFGGMAGAIVMGVALSHRRSFHVLAVCYLWAAVWVFVAGAAGPTVPLLATAVMAAGAGIIGGQSASHALCAEFYRTSMRSTGVGWALGIGRIGSIAGPLLGGYLLATGGGAQQVIWMASIPALVATIAAAVLGARTDLTARRSVESA
jgi:AAHS family 4-hydroxybenzoate transporter-like MFS transporter